MSPEKIKTRKCKNRKCRDEFTPNRDWQKYCSLRCRFAVQNQKRAAIVRKARTIIEAQQQGAA